MSTKKLYSTTVINLSGNDYVLKEGNAGVYSQMSKLPPRSGKFTIQCNPNATYREYWVGTDLAKVATIISSDDCMEYEVIKIKDDPVVPGKAALERVARQEDLENTSLWSRMKKMLWPF